MARVGRAEKKVVFWETHAVPSCRALTTPIPEVIRWKFDGNFYNRFFVKFVGQNPFRPPLRESCISGNRALLRGEVNELLEASQPRAREIEFYCEARLGRVVWNVKRNQQNCRRSSLEGCRTQLYTRTTTKEADMLERFKELQTKDQPMEDPTKIILLTLINHSKVHVTENPQGTFALRNEQHEGKEKLGTLKADFTFCSERFHDVRIACTCKTKPKTAAVAGTTDSGNRDDITEIIQSMSRNDDGVLMMRVKFGSVKVDHIRERKTHVFTTAEGYVIRFYKLKEFHVEELGDGIVEINGHDNQEIEVGWQGCYKDPNDPNVDIPQEVNKLLDFAMDVVDMAEGCHDPTQPY